MKAILDLGVLVVTMLMMATVGMELETPDFREVARRKGVVLGVLLMPAVLLPLLGFALAQVLSLPPHLTAGILLLAACPVGDIANFYALLARGNVALSVSVNALSCLFSVVTMGVAFELYSRLLGERYVFALPTPVLVLRLVVIVAVPVLAGMGLRRWNRPWVDGHRKTLRCICLVGIGLVVLFVMMNRWTQVMAGWRVTALAGAVFLTVSLGVGMLVARLFRFTARDTITVCIVFAVRNVALAGAIAVTLMNRIDFAEVAVVYFLIEIPLLLGLVGAYRHWWAGRQTTSQPVGARI